MSASVRAPNASCARLPGPRPRATPRSKPGSGRGAGSGVTASLPRMLCVSMTCHISPVMNVMKSTMRPDSTHAHLLCVPGSTTQHALLAVIDAADDLRLLAAHDVGHAVRVARARAGHDRRARRWACARGRPTSAVSGAGHGMYGASTHPWRLPIMPHAMRGARSSRQSPSSRDSASSKRPSCTCRCRAARCAHRALRPCAVMR